jgi:hypothetical protein
MAEKRHACCHRPCGPGHPCSAAMARAGVMPPGSRFSENPDEMVSSPSGSPRTKTEGGGFDPGSPRTWMRWFRPRPVLREPQRGDLFSIPGSRRTETDLDPTANGSLRTRMDRLVVFQVLGEPRSKPGHPVSVLGEPRSSAHDRIPVLGEPRSSADGSSRFFEFIVTCALSCRKY